MGLKRTQGSKIRKKRNQRRLSSFIMMTLIIGGTVIPVTLAFADESIIEPSQASVEPAEITTSEPIPEPVQEIVDPIDSQLGTTESVVESQVSQTGNEIDTVEDTTPPETTMEAESQPSEVISTEESAAQSDLNVSEEPSSTVIQDDEVDRSLHNERTNQVSFKVRYVDETGKDIVDPEIIISHEGETYGVSAKYIEGYVLLNEEESYFQDTASKGMSDLVFHYVKKKEISLQIHYIDEATGENIISPIEAKGYSGEGGTVFVYPQEFDTIFTYYTISSTEGLESSNTGDYLYFDYKEGMSDVVLKYKKHQEGGESPGVYIGFSKSAAAGGIVSIRPEVVLTGKIGETWEYTVPKTFKDDKGNNWYFDSQTSQVTGLKISGTYSARPLYRVLSYTSTPNDDSESTKLSDDGTGTLITGEPGVIPEGVTLSVDRIVSGTLFDRFKLENERFSLLDISLLDINDVKIQPDGKVQVKLLIPDGYNKNSLKVYHIDEMTGKKTVLNGHVEGNYYVFETTHFSYFLLVDESSAVNTDGDTNNDPATDTNTDDKTDGNTSGNPVTDTNTDGNTSGGPAANTNTNKNTSDGATNNSIKQVKVAQANPTSDSSKESLPQTNELANKWLSLAGVGIAALSGVLLLLKRKSV